MSQLEQSRQAAAEEGQRPSAWERPWVPWAIGAGLFLLGALIGWASTFMAIRPLLRSLPAVEVRQVIEDSAWAAPEIPSVTGAPGEQVELAWYVLNNGTSTWVVDSYRFVPAGGGARVLSLHAPVPPGDALTVRTLVTVPPLIDSQVLVWELIGPGGPVPGGRIQAVILSDQPGRRPHSDPTE